MENPLEMGPLLEAALGYAALGWRVVPVHNPKNGGCSCRCPECENIGKHPRLKAWQTAATSEEATIRSWWAKWPEANIGVRLGEQSGIVDLEGDGPEADKQLSALFDNNPLVCPTYKSHRGKHRLFRWRKDLPGAGCVKYGDLELRTGNGDKGIQSVFPCSLHELGMRYTWLPDLSPADVAIPELPDAVVAKLWNMAADPAAVQQRKASARAKLYTGDTPPTIPEGDRDNTLYAEACAHWNDQAKLRGLGCFDDPTAQSIVHKLIWAWNRACCMPPLDDATVLAKVESARKFIRDRTIAESNGHASNDGKPGPGLTGLGLEFREGEWWPGSWRLETINSDPPMARLHAPFLARQCIDLTMDQFDQAGAVHRAILKATGQIALDDQPGKWEQIWKGTRGSNKKKGTRGLEFKLLDGATRIEAPDEVKRPSIVAEFVFGWLSKAMVAEEDKEPLTSGRPWKDASGAVWFSFQALWQEAGFEKSDKITRQELSACLAEAGADRHVRSVGKEGGRKPFMRLDVRAMEKIRKVAGLDERSEG